MATGTGTAKGPAVVRYDTFVAQQLARTEGRVRALDLAAGLLGFVALSLAWFVALVLCDRKLELSTLTRQLAFVLYLIGAGCYLWWLVLRPLRHRLNPYYAALLVEATLPGAKNSVVNWVDLHNRDLPTGVRGALAHRAARDLSKADMDHAVSGRRAAWVGGLAALATVAFVATFLLLGAGPFYSLLLRSVAPFGTATIATRTQLRMVRPETGNATVVVGRPVPLVVEVLGRVPDLKATDAVRVQYHYEDGEPYIERLLQPGERREWTTTLAAIDIRNGLWYRVAAGDALTPEYHISVRAEPFLTSFLATYHYRPYVGRVDEVSRDRELKALRGTQVLIRARTNRTLASASLEWESKSGSHTVPAQLIAGDPQSFEVSLVLDEDGKYRLGFTSSEGETWSDAATFAVTAIPDHPPEVELTKPGQDVVLPADGLLELEGKATDDIGVKSIALRAQVLAGSKLRPRPYRGPDGLHLPVGGYPMSVDYKDFLDLTKIHSEDGKSLTLQPGSEVEYWLEAADACDYDRPHVSQSKHYRIQIAQPRNDAAQQQQRQRAQEQQQQHRQQQDRQLQQENKQRQQEAQQQQKRNEQERDRDRERDQQPDQQQQGEKKPGKGNDADQREPSGDQQKHEQPSRPQQDSGNNLQTQHDSGNEAKPGERKDDSGAGLTPREQEQQKRLEDAMRQREKPGRSGDGSRQQAKLNGTEEHGEHQNDKTDAGGHERADGPREEGDRQPQGDKKDAASPDKPKAGKSGGKPEANSRARPKSDADAKNGEKKKAGEPDRSPGSEQKDKQGSQDSREGAAENRPGNQPGAGEQGESKKETGSQQPQSQGRETKSPQKGDNKAGSQGQAKPEPGSQKVPAKESKPQAGSGDPGDGTDQRQNQPAKDTPTPSKGGKQGSQSGSGAKKEPGQGAASKPREGAGEQGPSAGTRQGEANQGQEQPRQATQQDVDRLSRDLKSSDPATRQEAARRLDDISKKAADGAARQAAQKALKESDQAQGPSDNQREGASQQNQSAGSKPGAGNADSQQARKATTKDVEQLAKDLKSPDAAQRQQTARRLEDISKNASDGAAREAAQKALQQQSKAAGKSSEKPSTREGQPSESGEPNKGPQGDRAQATPRSRDAGQKADESQRQASRGSDPHGSGQTDNGRPGDSPGHRAGKKIGRGERPAGNDPGEGTPGERVNTDQPSINNHEAPPLTGVRKGPHRPTVMQLEEFRKKVNKDILKDAHMSEEEFQRFLKAYEEAVRRQKDHPARPETAPQAQTSGSLPSFGKAARPPVQDKTDDLGPEGRALPPSPYRDSYGKFTRELSKPKK